VSWPSCCNAGRFPLSGLPLEKIGRDKERSVFPGRHALVLPEYPVEAGNTVKPGMHRLRRVAAGRDFLRAAVYFMEKEAGWDRGSEKKR